MSDGLDPILQQKEQQQLKTQLLWRLGIAGGLIAVILLGIAWLDQNNQTPALQSPQIAPQLVASEVATAAPTQSPIPTESSTPTELPTPTTSPSAIPSASPTLAPTATPATEPTAKHSAPLKIDNVPQRSTIPTLSIKPEINKNINPTAIPPAATAIPLKATNTALPTSTAQTNYTPAPTRTEAFPRAVSNSQGYSVQAGVFLHANNAEKLLAQLQQAGIPAYLETRVQIGPFKNKMEADAAVKKLKALGITPVVKTE